MSTGSLTSTAAQEFIGAFAVEEIGSLSHPFAPRARPDYSDNTYAARSSISSREKSGLGTAFRRHLPVPEMKNLVQQEAAEIAEGSGSPFSASSASSCSKPSRRPIPSFAVFHCMVIVLLGLGLTSCCTTKDTRPPLATAEAVDLSRYAGRWFEIARLPMPFQKAGEAAIAEYGRNADGTLSVHNIAIRPDGSQRGIRGYAKVLNPLESTKLTVRFRTWFRPLIPVPKEGNYWVLHVDDSYQEAIVGTPNRKYPLVERSSNTVTELMWRLAGGSLLRRARTLAAGARLTISLTMLVSSRNTAGHRKLTGR